MNFKTRTQKMDIERFLLGKNISMGIFSKQFFKKSGF
jgi:hypothetical protein